jgi:uncharacterized protein (DUF488 family)
MSTIVLWTIGHSTHSIDAFVDLLVAHDIAHVADVRTVPRSRRHPHFSSEALGRALVSRGLGYEHLPRLGGWRAPQPTSPNRGWENRSFRGYADYAMEEEFAIGLTQLRDRGASRRTAMMCSEALWWRCHRRLIADRLLVRGDTVWHIGSGARASKHQMTPFALVGADRRITYPSAEAVDLRRGPPAPRPARWMSSQS